MASSSLSPRRPCPAERGPGAIRRRSNAPVIALDTSVLVASFSTWHEAHDAALRATREDAWLPAHVLLESYSILTRMPEPYRAAPDVVAEYLRKQWGERILVPATGLLQQAPQILASHGVPGGSTYDALVGLTAREGGCSLLTLDLRARRTYDALGVEYRVLR